MSNLVIRFANPTYEQMKTHGDAALRSGDATLALGIYRAALSRTTGAELASMRVRVGLALAPNSRTQGNLDALNALETLQPLNAFVGDGLATWGKTLWFLDDPRFLEVEERHRDLLPLANWQWNLGTVLWAVQQAKDLDGDFVELGVFKGHTTLFVADYLAFATWKQRWVLYDTFDGIPDDQVDSGWADTNTRVYRGTFTFEEVRDRFAAFPNIQVIKGRVPEALEGTVPERISFLHMDMNNATAEIAALEALFDRIVPGGVIVFDDYVWAVSGAQFLTERAWFAKRGLVILPLPTGQGVFVKTAG